MTNKVVCVLGMHRSGTSMLSNWLHQCGLNLGKELLRADFSNQSGHFEDLDFLQMHKDILEEHGVQSSGLFLESAPILTTVQQQKLSDLVERRNLSEELWAWKDPRTCLFIHTYLELIPNLFIITIIRDYRSSIASILNRDVLRIKEQQYDGIHGGAAWLFARKKIIDKVLKNNLKAYQKTVTLYYRHIHQGLLKVHPDSRLVIELEDLLQRDNTIHSYLSEKLQQEIDFVPFDKIFQRGRRKAEISKSDIPESEELETLQNGLKELKTVLPRRK